MLDRSIGRNDDANAAHGAAGVALVGGLACMALMRLVRGMLWYVEGSPTTNRPRHRPATVSAASDHTGIRRRGVAFTAAIVGAMLVTGTAHAEMKLNVESYIGVPDRDLSGAIVITNAGEAVELNSVTLNRVECRVDFYEPAGSGAQAEMALLPMPLYMAFNANQRQVAAASAQTLGRSVVKASIHLKTGDQIAILAPSILPALRNAGFADAGNCGSALINMTLHSTSGDFYFEW